MAKVGSYFLDIKTGSNEIKVLFILRGGEADLAFINELVKEGRLMSQWLPLAAKMAEKQITLSKLRESFKTSPVQFPDSEDSMGEIIVKLFDTKIINEVHLSGSVKAKTFTIYNECQVQLQKIIPVAMDTTLARLTLPPPPSGLPRPSPPLPPQPTDEYTKLSCLMERSESIMENSFQMMKGMTELMGILEIAGHMVARVEDKLKELDLMGIGEKRKSRCSFYSTNEHSYKECEFKCRCIKCG